MSNPRVRPFVVILALLLIGVTTCIALVSARLGLCITTESGTMLRLPGVVFRPLRSRVLKDIELSCVYRRNDPSSTLATFLEVVAAYPKTGSA